jgi:TRAP-type mannitol/chloroaromatic compound transport system permease small subunit
MTIGIGAHGPFTWLILFSLFFLFPLLFLLIFVLFPYDRSSFSVLCVTTGDRESAPVPLPVIVNISFSGCALVLDGSVKWLRD